MGLGISRNASTLEDERLAMLPSLSTTPRLELGCLRLFTTSHVHLALLSSHLHPLHNHTNYLSYPFVPPITFASNNYQIHVQLTTKIPSTLVVILCDTTPDGFAPPNASVNDALEGEREAAWHLQYGATGILLHAPWEMVLIAKWRATRPELRDLPTEKSVG